LNPFLSNGQSENTVLAVRAGGERNSSLGVQPGTVGAITIDSMGIGPTSVLTGQKNQSWSHQRCECGARSNFPDAFKAPGLGIAGRRTAYDDLSQAAVAT
jgi:hypothetical protein